MLTGPDSTILSYGTNSQSKTSSQFAAWLVFNSFYPTLLKSSQTRAEEPYLAWFAHNWATEEFIKILFKNRHNYLASLAHKNGTSNQENGGRKENGEEEEENGDEDKDEDRHESKDGVGDNDKDGSGSEDEGGHWDGDEHEHGGEDEYEDKNENENGEEDEDGEGMKTVATTSTICAKAISHCNKAGSDSNDDSMGTVCATAVGKRPRTRLMRAAGDRGMMPILLWNSLLSYLISSYQPCLSHLIK